MAKPASPGARGSPLGLGMRGRQNFQRLRARIVYRGHRDAVLVINADAHTLAALIAQPEVLQQLSLTREAACNVLCGANRLRVEYEEAAVAERIELLHTLRVGTLAQHNDSSPLQWIGRTQCSRILRQSGSLLRDPVISLSQRCAVPGKTDVAVGKRVRFPAILERLRFGIGRSGGDWEHRAVPTLFLFTAGPAEQEQQRRRQ